MADPKFKKGDDVYFLMEKTVCGHKAVEWDQSVEGKIVGRGQVIGVHDTGNGPLVFYYEIEIAEPFEFYGSKCGFSESYLSKNLPGIKSVASNSVSAPPHPQPTYKEKAMRFFGAPSQSELGPKCPVHPHVSMKPLGTSFFCPECEKAH